MPAIDAVSLQEYQSKRRLQELVFDIAKGMAKRYVTQPHTAKPSFPL